MEDPAKNKHIEEVTAELLEYRTIHQTAEINKEQLLEHIREELTQAMNK